MLLGTMLLCRILGKQNHDHNAFDAQSLTCPINLNRNTCCLAFESFQGQISALPIGPPKKKILNSFEVILMKLFRVWC
jgi:hypothetical protein